MNNVEGISAKRGKTFLSCALISVSFWLAMSAFSASKYIDNNDTNSHLNANFYSSSVLPKDARLAAAIEREAKSLGFMVWKHERLILSRDLSEMLQKRINFDPFNGKLWLQLSYLQKDAGVNIAERAWTIERAARLLNWNFDQRSKISHYCIAEYAQFQRASAKLCSSLILNLPDQWSDQTKAGRANVGVDTLRAVLMLEQAKLEKATAP